MKKDKLVTVKTKTRSIGKWKIFETKESVVQSPRPDSRKEEATNRSSVRLSSSSSAHVPKVEVDLEKKTSKNETWDRRKAARNGKK